MLRKLVALATLGAAFLVGSATGASADPYSPKVPTQTKIEIIVDGPGKPIKVKVSADANSDAPPTGRIDIRIDKGGSAKARAARAVAPRPVWQTSVRFDGTEQTITGPELSPGRYVARASFTPDDANRFEPSSSVTAFRVTKGSVGGVEASDGSGVGSALGGTGGAAGGGLPNTGGPAMLWLVLGLGLVGVGGAGVAYARREPAAV